MPIRDELPVYKSLGASNNGGGGGANPVPAAQLARLNLDPSEAQGAAGGGPENPEHEPGDDGEEDGDIEEGAPEDQQMQRLRKGFRLSSMCWD